MSRRQHTTLEEIRRSDINGVTPERTMSPSVKRTAPVRSLLLALLLLSTTACQGGRISMEEINGILHVTNPDEPAVRR